MPDHQFIFGSDIPTLQQQVNNLIPQNYYISTIGWTGTQYFIRLFYGPPEAYGTFNWTYQFTFYADGSIPADIGYPEFMVGGNNGILALYRINS